MKLKTDGTPDFDNMTRDELIALTNTPGAIRWHATSIRTVTPEEARGDTLTFESGAQVPSTISVTFRADRVQIERLDALAGRDKDGRSGLIRAAIAHYLADIDAGTIKAA
jgi:hypothetical protein